MKKIQFLILFAITFHSYSQQIVILQGDLGFLKGQKVIKLEFDYGHINIVGGGTEKEYKEKKIEYLNNKEAGRGNKFERTWNQFRLDYFEPKFTEAFVKHSKLAIMSREYAKYTLIFKTLQFEDQALLVPPNEEAKATNRVAVMDGEAWIVETENLDSVLVKIAIKKIPGRDSNLEDGRFNATMADYDVRVRLSFTYAKAGKELGSYIAEKMN